MRIICDTLSESTRSKESFKRKRFLINSLLFSRGCQRVLIAVFFPPWRTEIKRWTAEMLGIGKQARRVGRDLIWSDLVRSAYIWCVFVGVFLYANAIGVNVARMLGAQNFKHKHSCLGILWEKWSRLRWTSGYIWIDWWRERIKDKVALWKQYKNTELLWQGSTDATIPVLLR